MKTHPHFLDIYPSKIENLPNWLAFLESLYDDLNESLTPDKLVLAKVTAFRDAGFQIVRATEYEENPEEEEVKEKQPEGPQYKVVVETDQEPIDIALMGEIQDIQLVIDELMTDEALELQTTWIVYHYGLEIESYLTGLEVFMQYTMEGRRASNKARGKSFAEAQKILGMVNELKNKIFRGSTEAETRVRKRTKGETFKQVQMIKDLRKATA